VALLVDSSVFITLERRRLPLSALIAATEGEPLDLAAVTASELLVGVHRADTPARRLGRDTFVEALLAALPVAPFDLPVARVHAELCATLAAVGRVIGSHDLLIAATALVHRYAVLTENLREFERVPGLAVRRPGW